MKTTMRVLLLIALTLLAFSMSYSVEAYSPLLQATATTTAVTTETPSTGGAEDGVESIAVQVEGLFPEGVEYDAGSDRFLVSSTSNGHVYAVGMDGEVTDFVRDQRIPSSLGLEVDEANQRLWVVAHNYADKAFVGVYDLETGTNTVWVDLAPLTPNANRRFPNDVTVDADGNAYVTDSITGMIYRVTPQGQASVFLRDDKFSTDFALNGIAYHETGNYLIAVLKPGLIKIPLDNPQGFTPVTVEKLGNEDGIIFLNDSTLAVVENMKGQVFRVESEDDWVTAKVTGMFETGNVLPTTVAARNGTAYVLYSFNNAEKEVVAEFPIQRVDFGAAE
jgi:sugar lactone lactonase YvrE